MTPQIGNTVLVSYMTAATSNNRALCKFGGVDNEYELWWILLPLGKDEVDALNKDYPGIILETLRFKTYLRRDNIFAVSIIQQ